MASPGGCPDLSVLRVYKMYLNTPLRMVHSILAF
jgi:hypothetical protein